jgi:hypothetical protein
VEIQPEELANFSNNYLIKLKGDKKIWKLEGNIKRLIPNPDIFNAYGFKWQDIETVNWPEFNAYAEGTPLK